MSTERQGGRILVEQLLVHGADTVFSVPGESFLPVLDGLHEHRAKVKLVTCRHESGAANMAAASFAFPPFTARLSLAIMP